MKLVNEPRNRGGATPSAGCVCFNWYNHKETKGLSFWFRCNCGCMSPDNNVANRKKAIES